MKIGIVGLKNSGKTTIFSALTGAEIDLASYRKVPNLASIKIPDHRLDKIANLYPDRKKINTTIDFIDIAETGEKPDKGFSIETINQLKYCDEILTVIRAFINDAIPSPIGKVDIKTEYDTIISDLIFSDYAIIDKRLEKLEKNLLKKKDENEKFEFEILKKCLQCIEQDRFLNTLNFSTGEAKVLRGFQFLTSKPIIFGLNISENDIGNEEEIKQQLNIGEEIKEYDMIIISGKLEQEINQLDDDEAEEFIQELGIKEPGIDRLIKSTYRTLNLISFFTIGDNEVKAWTIKEGTPAKEAAGKIHTDMEKGFIKAEVVRWEDLAEHESMSKCREKGILRTEGKEYPVKDGDVILVRFNV